MEFWCGGYRQSMKRGAGPIRVIARVGASTGMLLLMKPP